MFNYKDAGVDITFLPAQPTNGLGVCVLRATKVGEWSIYLEKMQQPLMMDRDGVPDEYQVLVGYFADVRDHIESTASHLHFYNAVEDFAAKLRSLVTGERV